MSLAVRARRGAVGRLPAALGVLLSPLSLGLAGRLGAWLGRWVGRRRAADRARAIAALEASLGVAHPEAEALADRMFAGLGQSAAELAHLARRPERVAAHVSITPAGARALAAAVEAGRGVVAVSAHLASWELVAAGVAARGYRVAVVARRPNNPGVASWLAETRRRLGVVTIERGAAGAAGAMLSALRQGALLAFLVDQRTAGRAIDVTFFGRPAPTPIGWAELAVRRRRPVLFVHGRRRADGGLELDAEPIPTDGREPAAVVADATARIERAIRARPAEWPWFHERFRPPP